MAYDADPVNRLAAVRTAIDKVLFSQEYAVGSRRNKYAELDVLFRLEKDLITQSDRVTTPVFSVAQIDRPNQQNDFNNRIFGRC